MQWSVKKKEKKKSGMKGVKKNITFYIYKVFQGESLNTSVCATALAPRSRQGKPCGWDEREERDGTRVRAQVVAEAGGGRGGRGRVVVLVIWCPRRSSDWCCSWATGPRLSWPPAASRCWSGSPPGEPRSRWPARACDTATPARHRLF